MNILAPEQQIQTNWEYVINNAPGVIVEEAGTLSRPDIPTLINEHLDISSTELSRILDRALSINVLDRVPGEFLSIVQLKARRGMTDAHHLSVSTLLCARADLMEYYQDVAEGDGEKFTELLPKSVQNYEHYLMTKPKYREATESRGPLIPNFADLSFSLHPQALPGVLLSTIWEIRIDRTFGAYTPLRYSERERFGLLELFLSEGMIGFAEDVALGISMKREEDLFIRGHTISNEGISCFQRNGYEIRDVFDDVVPGLREECPETREDREERTYKFVRTQTNERG